MPPHATFNIPPSPKLCESNKIYSAPSGSIYPHLLLALSLPIAFIAPPFPGRAIFFCAIILGLAISTQIEPHFTNDPGTPFAMLWSVWFSTLEKFLTASQATDGKAKPRIGPESLFWRNGMLPHEAENFAAFRPAKIVWALGLVINLRGIGWNHQVRNVPQLSQKEKHSRTQFLVLRVYKTLYSFFMADLVNHLWMELFYVGDTGHGYTQIGAVNSKYLTLKDPDWTWRLVKTIIWGAFPYYFISLQYNTISVVAVSLKISEPEDWPLMFGKISHVTTIRAFWGKFWQQLIRRSFNAFTGFAVDALHIRRGTTLSSQTQVYIAFFISSIFHAQSNLIIPAPDNIDFYEKTTGMFQFFMWQALAISIEDCAQMVWSKVHRRLGVRRESRFCILFVTVLGWLWVCFSMWLSMPYAADTTLRLRFGDRKMIPVTIIGPWIGPLFLLLRSM